MLNTLAEIQAYFENIAEVHPDINDFVVGDSEQILSLDRSNLSYPVLWLETPTVNWSIRENPARTYDTNFVVLINSPADTWQHQQYILNRTLTITEQILSKIKDDHSDGKLVKLENRATSNPILGYGHDHDWGWRTRLSIDGYMITCAGTCKFPTDCEPAEMASFTWANNILNGFNDVEIVDTSTFTPGQAAQWTYQIDEGAVVSSSTPPNGDLGTGNYMLVTLTLIDDKCTKKASAFFMNAVNCGDSVPYIIDKKYC